MTRFCGDCGEAVLQSDWTRLTGLCTQRKGMIGSVSDLSDDIESSEGQETDGGGNNDSDAESNNEVVTKTIVKEDLLAALNEVESDSSFATFRALPEFFDPGIVVDHCGPIKLPLSGVDASRIIAASHEAPFGKGADTIIDTSVRRTWELNRDQLRFKFKDAWQGMVDMSLPAVCQALGVGLPVTAELYKLLLYEKGALFKPHTDTEKVPGMFGTLVVCLPSLHTGGDIVLRHGGEQRSFSTEQYQPSLASWYSDVIHEIREVNSGYRLVLTYNLIKTSPDIRKPPGADERKGISRPLDKALRAFSRYTREDGPELHSELIFMLEHKYTDASLSLASLKRTDKIRARALASLASKHHFELYLASMERCVSGGCDESDGGYGYGPSWRDGWDSGGDSENEDEEGEIQDETNRPSGDFHTIMDECDSSLELKRLVNLDGTILASGIDVKEMCIVQNTPFHDRDPDDEDYEGWTGNEGANATHWYHDTVLIIVPKHNKMSFLLRPYASSPFNRKDIRPLLKSYMSSAPEQSDSRSDLLKICNFVMSKNAQSQRERRPYWYGDERSFNDEVVGLVIVALVQIGRPDLLTKAVTSAEKQVTEYSMRAMAGALSDGHNEDVFAALDLAMAQHAGLANTLKMLQATFGQDLKECHPLARPWIEERVQIAFRETEGPVSESDGAACAEFAGLMVTETFLKTHIISTVDKFANTSHFALAFLARWLTVAPGVFPPADVAETFSVVLKAATKHFMLVPPVNSAARARYEPGPTKPTSESVASNIGDILSSILADQKEEDLGRFCAALSDECRRTEPETVKDVVLPALRAIDMQALDALQLAIGPLVQDLYTNILIHFVLRYVGREPSMTPNWSRSSVGCGCGDCLQVSNFLCSSTQIIGRFAVNKNRRQHIHNQLDGSDCTHVTERQGRPQTLVVTKKDRKRAEHNAWKVRCNEARRQLRLFPSQDRLGKLMKRPAILDSLHALDFETLRGQRETNSVQSASYSSAPLAPTTGNKRKADIHENDLPAKRRVVIDLCSDSE